MAHRAAGDVMGRLSLQAQIDDFEAQLQWLAEMPTWRPAVVRGERVKETWTLIAARPAADA